VKAFDGVELEGRYDDVECGVVEECNGADVVEEGVTGKDAECIKGVPSVGDDASADVVPALGGCAEVVEEAGGGCGVVGLIVVVGGGWVCIGVGEGVGFGEDEVTE